MPVIGEYPASTAQGVRDQEVRDQEGLHEGSGGTGGQIPVFLLEPVSAP